MANKIRIGDIVEIPTNKGLSYAQYVLKKEKWGALLRILPSFFDARPNDFSKIVHEKECFVTFFPLQAAISREIFEVVGNAEIPAHALTFPLFRAAGFIDREGKVLDWWLWDGEREWRVEKLSEEQRNLPIRAVWNDTLLIERIEEGWKPSDRV